MDTIRLLNRPFHRDRRIRLHFGFGNTFHIPSPIPVGLARHDDRFGSTRSRRARTCGVVEPT